MIKSKRVAVLGGGVSALAAVWDLVHRDPNIHVSVYQMGWRLGGKCASGRNAEIAQRIEEHGLHILFGFYENAFGLYRQVFEELDPADDDPIRTWTDAFHAQNALTLAEQVNGRWLPWSLEMPPTAGEPGDRANDKDSGAFTDLEEIADAYAKGLITYIESHIKTESFFKREVVELLLHEIEKVVMHLGKREEAALKEASALLEKTLSGFWRMIEHLIDEHHKLRRLWIITELVITITKGLVDEATENQTREDLDQLDLLKWLDKHSAVNGGLSELTRHSAPIRMLYDLVFAYENGDTTLPLLEAGTAVIGAANILFNYHGSLFYQMQGGTGDILAGTIYRVLTSDRYKNRVSFHFFHEVTGLRLAPDGQSVESVQLNIQANTNDRPYEPLVTVKGLPSWPNAPLYKQLEQGAELEKGTELPSAPGFNLESPWTAWTAVGTTCITHGDDFDDLLLALPIAVINQVAQPLIHANKHWQLMSESVKTIATQSFQLWLNESVADLGGGQWQQKGALVHGTFQVPHSNWADWTDLIKPAEQWPPRETPKSLALICGVLKTAAMIPLPGDESDYPDQVETEVKGEALKFVEYKLQALWPKAYANGQFDYKLLADLKNSNGVDRFYAQYVRANISPSERYTASYPKTGVLRLKPDQSYYKHLYLAGDWTHNLLNFGAVEAAVISGRIAARGLLGEAYPIYGAHPPAHQSAQA